jgi:hypothetical protein
MVRGGWTPLGRTSESLAQRGFLDAPGWFVGVAVLAVVTAFAGAMAITLANHETEIPTAAPDAALTSADVAPESARAKP